jgi:L-alanine-DL-glutamate epimerase-like enolase superfamily enzyme
MATLRCNIETFPIAGRFVIARGAKTEARVVTVTIVAGGAVGRGECVPYARYGESSESVVAAIQAVAPAIERAPDRHQLQTMMPRGAARNAVDCALWDLEAKMTGVPAWQRGGCARPGPVVTAFTISLDTPEAMAAAARSASRPFLKIKLGGKGDAKRLQAVRAAAPDAALIVDANEAWRPADLEAMFAACQEARVALIEQPLPAGGDAILAEIPHPIPVCADESVHDRSDLEVLSRRYEAVNIKLDKTGGLTEALATAAEAEARRMTIMVGCMVGTSLAMAPALLLAARATYIDLDGPLLLARDRPQSLRFEGSTIMPAASELWG